MAQKQRVIDEFMELVKIDSETMCEQAISPVLRQKFEALGLEVTEDDAAVKTGHGAGNLFAWLPASEGHEDVLPILFTSHMDTVTPGKGIKPQLGEDGYIRSDGTTILGSDDKAGLAAMFEALRVIREENVPHGPIQFVITVGEESGLIGSRAMDASRLRAKYGFALDSSGEMGDIAIAAPSQAKIKITFRGKSAHAGVAPEKGVSAIQVAAKAISLMPLGRIDHETTANIGNIHGGGEQTNIVVDAVSILAEARSLNMEKLDRQLTAMREAVETAARDCGAPQADFDSYIAYPSFCFDESDEVVRIAKDALASLGLTPRPFHTGGGSDANVLGGHGVPTVNLAVGYEEIHTTQERIKAEHLVTLSEVVLAIIGQTLKLA
ncbi:M20/M25/M40 family metallo-hydrolase [Cohnella lubricantis]|uniref:M20/M25/M40 family metallo-hydrolase n=1 Tax=Cohnella lubricantis TaxID=2163172 RepID=A0A841TFD0_9BACL|nr:M20/M25/M40 family metallo-hydrolase [Cohnella lubricantis]MBB6677667.1 M20/M25/M40 family metallo-hydrolase [Cohnella lubricantis]MBP2117628.1 tripeptide aminopeptidase [Cohnella lubricantis]